MRTSGIAKADKLLKHEVECRKVWNHPVRSLPQKNNKTNSSDDYGDV
jgi:hypothetical protein